MWHQYVMNKVMNKVVGSPYHQVAAEIENHTSHSSDSTILLIRSHIILSLSPVIKA